MRPSALAALFCAISALLFSGCVSAMLAPKIVTAPNAVDRPVAFFGDNPEARVAIAHVYAQSLRVPVGPPAAELSVGVIEPGDYHHEHALTIERSAADKPPYFVSTRWDALAPDAPRVEPKGTIVLLHGFWMSKDTVLHWAIHLAQAGYRTVPVDLRGHGSSTGAWVTYGAVESGDLAQVLDELQRRGLAGERVGVLGVSYGASIALMWAARDARVASVVALEPFCDARTAIRQYARAMLSPSVNKSISDGSITSATSKAARLAAFSWDEVDVRHAVAQLKVPVLFVHGLRDTILPPEHSQELNRLAPPGSRLIEREDDDHFSLSMRLDGISTEVAAWFNRIEFGRPPSDPARQPANTIPEKHLASP